MNIDILIFRDIVDMISPDRCGHLIPIELGIDGVFPAKRIYYIVGAQNDIRRGFHAHKNLQQILICINGSVKIFVDDLIEQQTIELNSPHEGLYIGPGIWREMFDFSEASVLLVLASEHYDEDDYIRNYNDFIKWKHRSDQ